METLTIRNVAGKGGNDENWNEGLESCPAWVAFALIGKQQIAQEVVVVGDACAFLAIYFQT